jgi:hypothetical protein
MTRTVRRGRRGGALVRLDTHERLVLRTLLLELQALLGPPPAVSDPAGVAEDFEAIVAGIEADTHGGGAGAESLGLPADPVLARLLPDAYPAGEEEGRANSEFRRLTEADLRATKYRAAQRVLDTVPDGEDGGGGGVATVTVPAGDLDDWLAALNDLRLALGVHLDIDEEGRRVPSPDSPEYGRFLVYAWLTDLQGSLIELAEP